MIQKIKKMLKKIYEFPFLVMFAFVLMKSGGIGRSFGR